MEGGRAELFKGVELEEDGWGVLGEGGIGVDGVEEEGVGGLVLR